MCVSKEPRTHSSRASIICQLSSVSLCAQFCIRRFTFFISTIMQRNKSLFPERWSLCLSSCEGPQSAFPCKHASSFSEQHMAITQRLPLLKLNRQQELHNRLTHCLCVLYNFTSEMPHIHTHTHTYVRKLCLYF